MLLLLWLARRFRNSIKSGDVFNVYLIVYPVVRFCLDFLRLDASRLFGVDINQALMAVIGICAIVVFLWRHRPVGTTISAAAQPVRAAPVSVTPSSASKRPGLRRPTRSVPRKSTARRSAPKKRTRKG
jgi:hypothetical protein